MSGGPRCPNHKVILIRTEDVGIGICPISMCPFTYKALDGTKKQKVTSSGKIIEESDYKVEGSD